MNIKKLALIGGLAGLSGCYTVPVRSVVVAPSVVTPAPIFVSQPVYPNCDSSSCCCPRLPRLSSIMGWASFLSWV